MLTRSRSASCTKKKYISPTSIALPCDHSSVVRAPGHAKCSSTICCRRAVSSSRTVGVIVVCRWRAAASISGCAKWIDAAPSASVSIAYDGGDGGKKAIVAVSRSTEQRWLQRRKAIAVDMTQPMFAEVRR